MNRRLDDHIPDEVDDQNVRKAIEATRSAETLEQLAKLVSLALLAQWQVLARYARGNRDRLIANTKSIRGMFLALGLILVLIGATTIHLQDQRHADTLNTLARGFFYTSDAGCQRSDRRRAKAERILKAKHNPRAAAFAEPILADLAPFHADCDAYALQQVRKLHLGVSIGELERAVGYHPRHHRAGR